MAMDRMELALWASTIMEARQGNEAAATMLREENSFRKEMGKPTVEEEIKAIVAKARGEK